MLMEKVMRNRLGGLHCASAHLVIVLCFHFLHFYVCRFFSWITLMIVMIFHGT